MDNLFDKISGIITKLLFVAIIGEVIFHPQFENIYGCICLLLGWMLISTFITKYTLLVKYPLPVITIFSLGICYCFLPLWVTLIEMKPLSFNCQVPYLTYTNQVINIVVIIASFGVARRIYSPGNCVNRILNKVGYMSSLSDAQIWTIGLIGLAFLCLEISVQGVEQEYQSTGNTLQIISKSLSALSFAPICLFFKSFYSTENTTTVKKYIILYLIFLMLLGAATTKRELMFGALVSLGGLYLFKALYRNKKILNLKTTVFGILLAYLVTGPVADFATAMILNRQIRNSQSPIETFDDVLKLYNDKELLHTTYQASLTLSDNNGNNGMGWSEYYVDNIFLDRFCNLRTIDATIYNAQKSGFGSEKGQSYYKEFWINELPSFIVDWLGLDKNFIGTAADHMVVLNFGENRYSLFGCKVGGETGIGLWMFGYYYYLVAFITYIIVFYFLMSFVNIKNGLLIIPIPILIIFRRYWMFFLNANGIFSSMGYVFTRANLNQILIYCVLVFIVKKIVPSSKRN